MHNNIIPDFPLIFAPMEGITDHHFRKMILKNYPDWDFIFTDFLRLSTNQNFKDSHILNFYGKKEINYEQEYCQKVILQILSTEKSTTAHNIKQIANLGFRWIDLNLGCPSKQVNSHGGGAYLMGDLYALEKVLDTIRSNFSGFFSVKIRLGHKNYNNLFNAIKIFEKLNVNLITIHGRTQQELYKGKANWELINHAHQCTNIPLLGNGDIQTLTDIKRVQTNHFASGVMVARGALRRPWLANQYKHNSQDFDERENKKRMLFIQQLLNTYAHLEDKSLLKKMKKLTHYLFDPSEQEIKSGLLRSRDMREFMQKLPVIKP